MHQAYITPEMENDMRIICEDFNRGLTDQTEASDLLEILTHKIIAYDLIGEVVVRIKFAPNDDEKAEMIKEYGRYYEGKYRALVSGYDSFNRTFSITWMDDGEYGGEMTSIELYKYADYGYDDVVKKYLDQFQ
jgi:hypothetical protein